MSVTTHSPETEGHDAFSALGEALESAADTFGDLTVSARDGARRAARGVSNTVGAGVYKGSYGLSYGLVFGAVFLTELLPAGSSVRRGLEDGAHAAIDAATHRRAGHVADATEDGALESLPPVATRTRARRKPAGDAPDALS